MKINLEKNTDHKKISLKIFQAAISYILLAGFIFLGLPTGSQAQKKDDVQDNMQMMNGSKLVLSNKTNKTMNKMSARSYSQIKAAAKSGSADARGVNAARDDGTVYVVLNVEFKTAAARRAVFTDQKKSTLKNAYVLTTIDRFADVFIDTDQAWSAIEQNPNVLKVEYSTKVVAPPPPGDKSAELGSLAVPEGIVRGGLSGLTGKNVIVAILDTGIDFRHPDFITYDAKGVPTSRIAYLWDTATDYKAGRGSVSPVKFPNGSSIGTLYTKDQLTKELRSTTATIPATDINGHGTACASVAAGNGNADNMGNGLKEKNVVGVAPEADIIGVRLGYDGLENSYLLNAIAEWLNTTAGKTPLVASGSFGGHYTGHDGQRIEERQLNVRFPLDGAGRAIVFAAGNEGTEPIHAEAKFAKEPKNVSWNANTQTLIKIYFDSADENLGLIPSKATALGENLTVMLNPITNQYEAELVVNPGPGGIFFNNSSGKMSGVHLYFSSGYYGEFSPQSVSYSYLVGSPGSMENAITVGSYDWNDNFNSGGKQTFLSAVCAGSDGKALSIEIGSLSCYSSPGPNRNGVIKPDIVAPGEWYRSSYAKIPGVGGAEGWKVDSTGNYAAMNGTSAATPYTSGIVALMFQKKPTLTLGEIKRLLKGNASKTGLTPFSTAIPNNNWGYGKLDTSAINKIFSTL